VHLLALRTKETPEFPPVRNLSGMVNAFPKTSTIIWLLIKKNPLPPSGIRSIHPNANQILQKILEEQNHSTYSQDLSLLQKGPEDSRYVLINAAPIMDLLKMTFIYFSNVR
jgi:hypothetical protein